MRKRRKRSKDDMNAGTRAEKGRKRRSLMLAGKEEEEEGDMDTMLGQDEETKDR